MLYLFSPEYYLKRRRFFPVTNDFMFKHILSDPDIALVFIRVFLDLNAVKIVEIISEKLEQSRSFGKGVRLDLRVLLDDGTVVNIEMQTTDSPGLARRPEVLPVDAGPQHVG